MSATQKAIDDCIAALKARVDELEAAGIGGWYIGDAPREAICVLQSIDVTPAAELLARCEERARRWREAQAAAGAFRESA
jgi:hypothetical protein